MQSSETEYEDEDLDAPPKSQKTCQSVETTKESVTILLSDETSDEEVQGIAPAEHQTFVKRKFDNISSNKNDSSNITGKISQGSRI